MRLLRPARAQDRLRSAWTPKNSLRESTRQVPHQLANSLEPRFVRSPGKAGQNNFPAPLGARSSAWIEHQLAELRVVGSNPAGRTRGAGKYSRRRRPVEKRSDFYGFKSRSEAEIPHPHEVGGAATAGPPKGHLEMACNGCGLILGVYCLHDRG